VKPSTPLRRFFYYVAPLLVWMCLIFSASTDAGSAEKTNPLVSSIITTIAPGLAARLSPEQIDRIDWNIRKTAHVTEYALLAILVFRALAFGDPRFRHRNAFGPVLIAVLYAATDEFHQSFVPSRGAAASDVFYDATGAVIGTALCLWRHSARTQKAMEASSQTPFKAE